VVLAVWLSVLASDTLDPGSRYNRLVSHSSSVLFDFVGWEANALWSAFSQQMSGAGPYLNDDQGAAYVVGYLKVVSNLQILDSQIAAVYADPTNHNPATASADLRQKRDAANAEVLTQTPLAESIIAGQISAVLRDEGFATLGQVLPPLATHFDQLPDYLVVSPRDTIRFSDALGVIHLGADQADMIENSIDRDLNVSSLVVPLGGLSLYPSMVAQSSYALGLFMTVAHEWCHHYLDFFPLGLNYDQPETRVINESTAERFGAEIGQETLRRFYGKYPDIMRQLPAVAAKPTTPVQAVQQATPSPTPPPAREDRPSFNYGATMNETRVTVDFYLWLKQPDLAEAYMQAQRVVFAVHGYNFRKINQAFFAFYGGYQGANGVGAGGTDPTGPALDRLRAQSDSVLSWLNKMRAITNRADLLAAAGQTS
jgi:hypothetical protein